MKKLFVLAIIALISSFASAQELVGVRAERDSSLQDLAVKPASNYQFQVGDTIIIAKSVTKYLTGETPSSFVYYVRHTLQQIGGKRFPDGLLVAGIISWIGKDDAYLVGAVKKTEEALLKQQEDKHVVEDIQHELASMDDATRAKVEAYAKTIGGKVLEASVDTVVVTDTVTVTVVDTQLQDSLKHVADSLAHLLDSLSRVPVKADTVVVVEQVPVEQQPDTTVQPAGCMDKMHRFSVGLRGGVASLLQTSDVMGRWKAGFDVLLDLQYAYYFGAKEGKDINMGILTGLSLGYTRNGFGAGVDTAYTVSTSDGDINYTIKAEDVKEKDGQLQMEIPVMFSLLHRNGLFFNVGPRFVLPVYSPYNQSIVSPDINAFFPEEGVNVSNEVITGLVQDNQLNTKGKWSNSKFQLFLSAEIGYEWQLAWGHSLGLGAFANYNVLSNKMDSDAASLINVEAPSASSPANVDILSATDTYATKTGFFDCGVKLVYHFNFPVKK